MGHEFAETAFWERALFKPHEVFFRKIVDRDSVGRVFFFPEHPEGHVGEVYFREQIAEILAVDFGEVHIGKRDACGVAGVS